MKFIPIPGTNYQMAETQVTQAQWQKIMGYNPSHFKDKPQNPVETISWDDCQEFIKKLNTLSKKFDYRLPTEEEWEYCCRAGSTTDYCFGDSTEELKDYAWFCENSEGSTQPVKKKKPNKWGLYGMHGNIWEWVQDLWK